MSRRLILNAQMEQVIEVVCKEAGVAEDIAVKKIFALAMCIYTKNPGRDITIIGADEVPHIVKNVRNI